MTGFPLYAGPMLSETLRPILSEVVERDGFVFADVLQGSPEPGSEPILFDSDGRAHARVPARPWLVLRQSLS